VIRLDEWTYAYGDSSITLKPFVLEPTPENPDILGAYIRVDVTENINFPAEVFMWERYVHMEDNNELASLNRPVCIAKPMDLDTYPVGNPDPQRRTLPPFFREAWFEMTINSPEILIETWEHIKIDVARLVKSTVSLGGP